MSNIVPDYIVCKVDTDELSAGGVYEVLGENHDGYRIVAGKRTGWFRKDLFVMPKPMSRFSLGSSVLA